MLAHRDVVLLDVPENMNEGKTYAWYAHAWNTYGACRSLRWVGKADTDSYIRTVQLEKLMRSPAMQQPVLLWGVHEESSS